MGATLVRLKGILWAGTALLLGTWLWATWHSYESLAHTQSVLLRATELRGQILRLDELLTMCARMHAATGDAQWHARYTEHEPLLDAAIRELAALVPPSLGSWTAATNEANQKLVALERRAMRLTAEGDRAAAGALLGSDDYEDLKRTYAAGMSAVARDLHGTIRRKQTLERRKLAWILATGLLALLTISVWGLVRFRSHLRQHRTLVSELDTSLKTMETMATQLNASVEAQKKASLALTTAQDQLRQAQKMEAVGRLAGGIAHDFNNMLSVINGYADLALGETDPREARADYLMEIRKAGGRAAALTHQLLAFSRKQVLQPRVIDLSAVLADMSGMLTRVIGERIRLVTKIDENTRHIKADPAQLQQVILNLAVNARDAMPQGGVITVSASSLHLDRSRLPADESMNPGLYTLLQISDTGTGMDPSALAHLFEPFFSTKETGQGTGLGLSMVYGIVKQSGGHIWVVSELGQGTTFNIVFPACEAEVPTTRVTKTYRAGLATQTVLVVEDESMVRHYAKAALESFGYRVLAASSGSEALEILKAAEHPIDLLLTDVVMPRMNGHELTVLARRIRSDIAVLMMSGYTDDPLVQLAVDTRDVSYIQKPFTPAELHDQTQRAIRRARNADTHRDAP